MIVSAAELRQQIALWVVIVQVLSLTYNRCHAQEN